MHILKNDFIVAFWFSSNKKDDNVQYILIKRDDEWIVEFRMRYNKNDSDPFSDEDEKNVYKFSIKTNKMSEEDVVKKVNDLFDVSVKSGFNICKDHFFVNGTVEKFLEIAKTKEYMHIKEVPT